MNNLRILIEDDVVKIEKLITVEVKRKKHIFLSTISQEKAQILVKEGRAYLKDQDTIFIPLVGKKFKTFIRKRDNCICYYCGKKNSRTIDHKLPRSRGGYSTPANCVCCCEKCNCEKDNMTEEEYKEFKLKKGSVGVS